MQMNADEKAKRSLRALTRFQLVLDHKNNNFGLSDKRMQKMLALFKTVNTTDHGKCVSVKVQDYLSANFTKLEWCAMVQRLHPHDHFQRLTLQADMTLLHTAESVSFLSNILDGARKELQSPTPAIDYCHESSFFQELINADNVIRVHRASFHHGPGKNSAGTTSSSPSLLLTNVNNVSNADKLFRSQTKNKKIFLSSSNKQRFLNHHEESQHSSSCNVLAPQSVMNACPLNACCGSNPVAIVELSAQTQLFSSDCRESIQHAQVVIVTGSTRYLPMLCQPLIDAWQAYDDACDIENKARVFLETHKSLEENKSCDKNNVCADKENVKHLYQAICDTIKQVHSHHNNNNMVVEVLPSNCKKNKCSFDENKCHKCLRKNAWVRSRDQAQCTWALYSAQLDFDTEAVKEHIRAQIKSECSELKELVCDFPLDDRCSNANDDIFVQIAHQRALHAKHDLMVSFDDMFLFNRGFRRRVYDLGAVSSDAVAYDTGLPTSFCAVYYHPKFENSSWLPAKETLCAEHVIRRHIAWHATEKDIPLPIALSAARAPMTMLLESIRTQLEVISQPCKENMQSCTYDHDIVQFFANPALALSCSMSTKPSQVCSLKICKFVPSAMNKQLSNSDNVHLEPLLDFNMHTQKKQQLLSMAPKSSKQLADTCRLQLNNMRSKRIIISY